MRPSSIVSKNLTAIMHQPVGRLLLTFAALMLGQPSWADLVVDGVNNFASADTYATGTSGYTGYAALGPSSLNFGLTGGDVQSGGSQHWYVAYIGANGPSTTTGLTFNTQQPTLSFGATHFLQWRPSDQFATLLEFNGANWVSAGSGWQVARSGQFVEAGIPLTLLGSPSTVQIAAYMLYEGSGFESSYAPMPSDAFAVGYDPNVASSLTLNSIPEPSSFIAVGLVFAAGTAAIGRRPQV